MDTILQTQNFSINLSVNQVRPSFNPSPLVAVQSYNLQS